MIRLLLRRSGPLAAALLLAAAGPGQAQMGGNAADRLSSYLRELAGNPNSLSALIGAGQASLGVGDGNAALGFFARADEQAPRNGQVKAGLARALLMVDNPRDALRMFEAAVNLGVPEADLAGDRGLAFDLRGDQKRAQRDYALALSRGPNDEITRRYALSLGISGDRDTALRLIDPLLYKRDQAAWRARAFVLAMTGDQAGANTIVRQVMPERMALAMSPFLQRLPSLRPAEKAAAVHLGEMPSDGTRYAAAPAPMPVDRTPPPPTRLAANDFGATAPARAPTPVSREPRRRPGAAVAPAPVPASPAAAAPAPTVTASKDAPPAALPPQQRGDLAAIMRDIRSSAASGSGSSAPRGRQTRLAQATSPAPRPAAKGRGGTAPDDEGAAQPDPKKPDPKKPDSKKKPGTADAKKKGDAAEAKAADAKGKKGKPEPKAAPRIWVQVASGSNASAMPREWSRIESKAGAVVKGRAPSTAPGRLLLGPFKTDAEAQAMVGKLRKAGVSSFQWESPAGQDVSKLGGK